MNPFRAFSLGLLILVIQGCSSTSSVTPISLLTGKTWELSSLKGQSPDPSMFPAGLPSLDFLEAGRLAGFTGCNNFSGGFSLEATDLKLDPGAMTRKACPGTGESEFISSLDQVKNIKVVKDKLILLDGETEVMSLIPKKD